MPTQSNLIVALLILIIIVLIGFFQHRKNNFSLKNKQEPFPNNYELPINEVIEKMDDIHEQKIQPSPKTISYAFVDLETTGLDSSNDRIIEICVFIITPGMSSHDGNSTLVNPGRPLRPFITELTGITNEMLKNEKGEECLHEFFDFIGDFPVYAYNADFDMGFLKAAATRLRRKFENPSVCILQIVQKAHPNLHSFKLQNACDAFEITVEDSAHRAEGDVKRAFALWNAVNSGKQPLPSALKPDYNLKEYSIYCHYRKNGVIFYVRTAKNNESSVPENDAVWSYYVTKKIHGQYDVKCLKKNISLNQAIEIKDNLLSKHSNELINRRNPYRNIILINTNRSRELKNASEEHSKSGRELEITNPMKSLELYKQALYEVEQYSKIIVEDGIFGELMVEFYRTLYGNTSIKILDRISLIYCREGNHSEAKIMLENVIEKYPEIAESKGVETIKKRILKAAKS